VHHKHLICSQGLLPSTEAGEWLFDLCAIAARVWPPSDPHKRVFWVPGLPTLGIVCNQFYAATAVLCTRTQCETLFSQRTPNLTLNLTSDANPNSQCREHVYQAMCPGVMWWFGFCPKDTLIVSRALCCAARFDGFIAQTDANQL